MKATTKKKLKKIGATAVLLASIGAAPIIPAGNGEISYARYVDHGTKEVVYQQIPDDLYKKLGEAEGQKYNPTYTSSDGVVVPMGSAVQYPTDTTVVDQKTLVATSSPIGSVYDKEIEARKTFSDNDGISLFSYITPKASAAIAWDAKSTGTRTTATSITWSHTMGGGSNGLLFTYCWVNGSTDNFTSLKFNAVTMSAAGAGVVASYNGGGNHGYMYYLVAPASGAHNIVLSMGASLLAACSASSYTGASQTGVPDASNYDAGDGSSSSYSGTVTTVADNAWLIHGSTGLDGTCTAGANTLMLDVSNPNLADSNGARTPAGSQSLNFTSCGNRVEDKITISFGPASAVVASPLQDGYDVIEDENN